MGFFDWLAPRELKQAVVTASVPIAPQFENGNAQGAYGAFAAEGYNANAVVNAAIREIATSASMPEFRLMRESADGGKEELKNELAFLLDHPNESQDQADFVETLTVHLMVSGNAYVMRVRNGSRRIVALRLLRPDRVKVHIASDGTVAYYEYNLDGRLYELATEDVAHLKLPNPYDDVYGLSPLQVVARYVNLDTSISTFLRAYFANAGVPAGILKVNRRITSQQEADAARQKWRSSFGGPRGWHGIAVLDEDAEYQQVAPNIADMDASTITAQTETRICAAFGVPPILIGLQAGLDSSTYSNYEQARSAFWDETVAPLVRRLEAFLERVLELPESEDGETEVEADYSNVKAYAEDIDALSKRTVEQYQAGIVTLNEARAALGLDPVDRGDLRRVPINVIEVNPDGAQALAAPETEEIKQLGAGRLADEVLKERSLPRSQALGDRLNAEREQLTDGVEKAMQRYFAQLRSRVAGVLGRQMSRATSHAKIAPDEVTVEMLFPAGSQNELARVLGGEYEKIIKATWETIAASGVAGVIEWRDNLPIVQQLVGIAENAAAEIDGVTRSAVSKAIELGIERGYTIEEVARGVPGDGYPGVNSLVEETYRNRARTIARTEVMRAQNATAVGYYRQQGIRYMRAYDPDGDPNDNYIGTDGRTCSQRNRQIYTSDDANLVYSHPNCRLTWTPISLTQTEEMGLGSEQRSAVVTITKIAPPEYVRSNARRGLDWYDQGRGGSGLVERTIREARDMAGGYVSEDKVVRMSAWFARHRVDLDSPANSDPNADGWPGPGAVAWALWGGDPLNPDQAVAWAQRQSERLQS
jgi:HK97 family phage portal protein